MTDSESPVPGRRIRAAFYGRIVRDDDPEAAIQRQLVSVTVALADIPIAGFFADVAPWNGLHGSTHPTDAWRLNGHPVDGGLLDLLDRTRPPEPQFDVVGCVDLERLSRRLVDRVRIEELLTGRGVRIVTPTDPLYPTGPAPTPVARTARRGAPDPHHNRRGAR